MYIVQRLLLSGSSAHLHNHILHLTKAAAGWLQTNKVFLRHPHTENIVWLLPPKLCFIMISIGIDCGIVDICIVIQCVVCLTAVEIVSSCVVVLDHIWVVTGERVAINPEFFNLKISWISLQLIINHKGKRLLSKKYFWCL